jgi:uncharacterized membrane protein YsdA (DUF1294 family)
MPKRNPANFFFVIAIALVAIISGLLYWMQVSPVYSYFVGMSLITFMFYGYDKRQSQNNRMRIPEIVLHILALLGGTLGALLGQLFFRHKTKKLKFRIVFFAIALLQILLAFYYWHYYR